MNKPVLTLDSPADILAAIPALIRFVPRASVVAILFSHASTGRALVVRCAIRFDVTVTAEQAGCFPETCGLSAEHNSSAMLVAICDPPLHSHALDVLDAARDGLEYAGIPVLRLLTTRSLAEPGQWVDPDTGEYGLTVAYTESVLSAQTVAEGTVIEASRDTIESEFVPGEPAPFLAVESTDFHDLVAATATELQKAIVNHTSPTAHLAARAAAVITAHTALRDALMRLGLGHELTAAQLWTALATHLRGTARAQLLTVAAFNYYLAGDTIRAGIALDHAGDTLADARAEIPTLAGLLRSAIQAGLPASALRKVVPDRTQAPIPGTLL